MRCRWLSAIFADVELMCSVADGIPFGSAGSLSRCGCRLLGDATVLCTAENIQANVIIGIYDGFR
jgi:hypothetical protein